MGLHIYNGVLCVFLYKGFNSCKLLLEGFFIAFEENVHFDK